MNFEPREYEEIYALHFERTRIYVAIENPYNERTNVLQMTERQDDYSYPLYVFYPEKLKPVYGTAADYERFKKGVYISDIINFIGKTYTQIPYPESYDIDIKQNDDNSVLVVTSRETGDCKTVDNIFTEIIERFNDNLSKMIGSKNIYYILNIPPYLTVIQTKIIEDTISKCGLKLIKTIYEPVASVYAYIKDSYQHKKGTYIVVNLDKNSFTGSVVTVSDSKICLNYYIRDDSLGYSQIENSFISSVYDEIVKKYEEKNKKHLDYKKLLKYNERSEKYFYYVSNNEDAYLDLDDYDIKVNRYDVQNLWEKLANNIHKKLNELYTFIDDNELRNIKIVTSGSAFRFRLFREIFEHTFYKYVILERNTNVSEISVTGAAELANDSGGYKIDSASFVEDMSFGIDLGNKYSNCSCFKGDRVVSTKQFKSFVDMTYRPDDKYINSNVDQIIINKELLRKMKNITCLSNKFTTTNLPTVFTIPLSYTVNQKYDLKKEAEECGYYVLYLLYSSFAAVIASIYEKYITENKCDILVFNFGENGNEMCIISKDGMKLELNTKCVISIEKYSYEDITKLFSDYISNDAKIFNEKRKKEFNTVIEKINENVDVAHKNGVKYILIVGDLKGFSMLKDNINEVFSREQIIYLPSDCISIGASVYANQLLTKSNYVKIVDYSKCDDISFGIDLGTTYSCAGIFRENNIKMVDYSSTSTSFSSCIFFEKKKNNVKYFQEKCDCISKYYPVYDSKRFIGKSYNKIRPYNNYNYLFQLVEEKKRVYYDIEYNNSHLLLSPEDISSTILRQIKEKSIQRIKTELRSNTIIPCVVTTPALFSYKQRFETRRAAEKAGLKVLSIINEPTAAAIAYINDNSVSDKTCKILVYDFGGGTFDVSIVEKNENSLRVICSDGDDYLGGEDITNKLVANILKHFKLEIENSKKSRVIRECEIAKIQLSELEECEISFEYNDKEYKKSVSRAELNELCKYIYKKTIEVTKRCVNQNRLNESDIKYIVLCGGSSRIPYVRDLLKYEFKDAKVMENINCKEAVAKGATVYANILRGKQNNFIKVTDVLNHSLYYIYTKKEELFEKNTPLDRCHTCINITTNDIGFAKIKVGEEINGKILKINEFNIYCGYKRCLKVYFDVDDDGVLVVSYIVNGEKKSMEYLFD